MILTLYKVKYNCTQCPMGCVYASAFECSRYKHVDTVYSTRGFLGSGVVGSLSRTDECMREGPDLFMARFFEE